MFTGIVEARGVLTAVDDLDRGRRFAIRCAPVTVDLAVGDSVAVQGACLTATSVSADTFTVELVPETVTRTSLGTVRIGDVVNLERAMRIDGRFDGHVVQGHVDGVGTVRTLTAEGAGHRLSVECPARLLRYVVDKGSITIDGVSLTIAALDDRGFEVVLIPHTAEVTTLGSLQPEDRVNLEVDILAKYVERLMETKP
jgi:riboflavin synthase